MTFLDLVILSLVTYRVTRFMQLDSLIDEWREWIAHRLLRGPTYHEGTQEWPFNIWKRKALQWVTCPFCQSVWFAWAALGFWTLVSDYTFGWRFITDSLAIAAGAMVVYKYVDPPHPPQPCVPTKPCE